MGKLIKSMKSGSKKIGRALGFDAVIPSLKKKPDITPPTPMADEEEVRRAMRRSLAARAGKGGRSATNLTGDDEPLG